MKPFRYQFSPHPIFIDKFSPSSLFSHFLAFRVYVFCEKKMPIFPHSALFFPRLRPFSRVRYCIGQSVGPRIAKEPIKKKRFFIEKFSIRVICLKS